MAILEQIFYFIIIIGVLVLVHELGHFLSAKLFRMRVERFSIGFPPRAFGRKIGETDYCVSWLPIGGYVKIAGMVDESLDLEHLNAPPQPWEYRAKPVWQRVIVISAGVIMNILLALAIFWSVNLFKGKQFYAVTQIGYVAPNSPAARAGFSAGDKIATINGREVKTWQDVEQNIYLESVAGPVSIAIERNGSRMDLRIPKGAMGASGETALGILPFGLSAKILTVDPAKPAAKVGLEPGDRILRINDVPVFTPDEVIRQVSAHPNQTIRIAWNRSGIEMSSYITPNDAGKIGISIGPEFLGPVLTEQYGFFEAVGVGTVDLVNFTALYLKSLGQIITGKASFSQSVGGPIKIAEMATQSAKRGIYNFLYLMAMLSVGLAVINIFPFPALDGGHLFFLCYEAVFKKEVPTKIRVALQQAGMVLLLALMAFVIYNDIVH